MNQRTITTESVVGVWYDDVSEERAWVVADEEVNTEDSITEFSSTVKTFPDYDSALAFGRDRAESRGVRLFAQECA